MAARTDDKHGETREETGAPVEPADDAPDAPRGRLLVHSSAPPPPPEAKVVPPGEHESAWFNELFRRDNLVLRLLRRPDVNPESAKDLRQEVFLTLHLQAQARGLPANTQAMLVRIAGNELCNHGRAQRHRPEADGGASADETPESRQSPEQSMHAADCARIVDDILSRMAPQAAELMRLVDLGGLSPAEVAEMQGRDPSTVWSHLCRARKRFEELALELHGVDLSDDG
jgi:RNA polymerase sigma-70 factor, ECF subfamily